MDKNTWLVELAGSEQTDFGRLDFPDQPLEQQIFSAVWALEGEVNGGGFASYFSSWDGDTANAAPAALVEIGAQRAADIVSRALAVVSSEPLPLEQDERAALIDGLDDAALAALDDLDAEFFTYPDNLTECLFSFVAERPQAFGPAPGNL